MERTWSNDSAAASSASSGAEETTSLATTIPGSTSRLLNNPLVESPLGSAAPVSTSTARRRYSWNVDEDQQITPKATRQRIPALSLNTSMRTRQSQPRSSSSVDAHNEAELFSDVVLSPIELKQFAHSGSVAFGIHNAAHRNSQHSSKTDHTNKLDHHNVSSGSASDGLQTDSEGEYQELDSLPIQSHHNGQHRLPAFESSSNPAGRRKSQASSRRARYPSLRTTGLDLRDDGDTAPWRRSLQDRAGDLIRQISTRVVNVNADEEDEESMPFNTIEEGDVQSDSDSDSIEVGEDMSELAYLDTNANGKVTDSLRNDSPTPPATQEAQIPELVINSPTIGVVQEQPRTDVSSSQIPSNEGKTLGLFGPTSRIRKACNTLIRNRLFEPIILMIILFHGVVLILQAEPALYHPREDDGYFRTWKDAALFVIFIVYTIEALARMTATGFLFDPQLVSVTDPSGSRMLLSHQQILSMRLKTIKAHIFSSAAWNDQSPVESSERKSVRAQLHAQQAWRAQGRRPLVASGSNSKGKSIFIKELPFEKAIQRQRSMALYSRPYLRHSWHRIDLVSIVAFWITFALAVAGQESTSTRHIFIFRALSILRVARLILITGGTSTVLQSLKKAWPVLARLSFFLGFVGLLFSIIGLSSFNGSMRRSCMFEDPRNSTNIIDLNHQCGGYIDPATLSPVGYKQWDGINMRYAKGYICPLGQTCQMRDVIAEFTGNFDTIFTAGLQSLIIASSNGWSDIMYSTIDSDFYASFIFSVFGVVLLNFWLVALVVAVVIGSFQDIRNEKGQSGFGGSTRGSQSGSGNRLTQHQSLEGWRKHLGKLEYFWVSLIILSLIIQDLADRSSNRAYDIAPWVITILLDLDLVIRYVATVKPRSRFFASGRNCFDLLIAVVSTILLPPIIQRSAAYPWLAVFILVRWYRVILSFPRMKPLIANVFGDFSGITNVILFLLMMNLLAALVAVQLFRGDIDDESINVDWSDMWNAFLGTFQVMTSENWTDPLFDTINAEHPYHQGTIACLFLASWFCVGNWVIFQLFVSVITESFQKSDEAKRDEQQRIHLQRDKPFLLHDKWFERYNPYRWMTPMPRTILPSEANTQVEPSSETSISLKLLPWLNIFTTPRNRPGLTADSHTSQDPGLQLLVERNPEINVDVVNEAIQIKRKIQASFIEAHPTFDRSLFIFWQHSKVRRLCQSFTNPAYGERQFGRKPSPRRKLIFEATISLTVVASIAVAATSTPLYRAKYYEQHSSMTLFTWFNLFDIAIAAAWFTEFVIKIVADGLFFTPTGYLKSPRHLFDLLALVSVIANTATSLTIAGANSRFIRSLMSARVVRLITISQPLRKVAYDVLWLSFGSLLDASVLLVLWVIPFASWMTTLFRNRLYSCTDTRATGITDCHGEYFVSPIENDFAPYLVPAVWTNPDPTGSSWSFDSFRSSFLILIEIISLEGWTDVLQSLVDISGEDKQGSNQASPQNAFPILIFQLIGAAVLLSIFLTILISAYAKRNGTALLVPAQLAWRSLRAFLLQQSPSTRPAQRHRATSLRGRCREFAIRKRGVYARTLTTLYVIHTILLMMQDYDESIMSDVVANGLFLGLTVIYLCDVVIRAYGVSPQAFIRVRWNVFDVVTVMGSLITSIIVLIIGQMDGSAAQQAAGSAQKLFLVLISFKLIERNNSLNQLFKTSVSSLPEIGRIVALWAILCLFYSILTTQVFGMAKVGNNSMSRHTNFRTWGDAMLMLAFMSTGEGWNGFMHDFAALESPRCTSQAFAFQSNDCGSQTWAYLIFITWNILSMYFMLNLFVAVVVDSFAYVYQSSGKAALSRSQMRAFKKAWATVDTQQTGYISDFSTFFSILPEPFCVRPYTGDLSLRSLLNMCETSSAIASDNPMVSGKYRTIDVAKLDLILNDVDRESLAKRRRNFNRVYQEAKLEQVEPGKGLSFQRALLLLAHYQLIDEDEALSLEELEERKIRKDQVRLLDDYDRVRAVLKGYICRRRHRAARVQRQRSLELNTDGTHVEGKGSKDF